MKIPDYYRQFQNQPEQKKEEEKKPESKQTPPAVEAKKEQPKPQPKPEDKTVVFQGNGFTINQLQDWEDKTIYTLTGPVTDGIKHNVILTVEQDVPFDTLKEYADYQIKTLEQELKGCSLLKQGDTKLFDGTEAYEAIFKWYPLNDFKIYQHQIYVLHEKTGFKLTASFTKKTRQTIGPQVERMMLSFKPAPAK
ncbi:MAG: DcrB-related protein [Ignavibacteriales bacterium]|nr:MAG: DcrB-related protein [Ignavibacteriales bacterium]